jgi:hypothetical protein
VNQIQEVCKLVTRRVAAKQVTNSPINKFPGMIGDGVSHNQGWEHLDARDGCAVALTRSELSFLRVMSRVGERRGLKLL